MADEYPRYEESPVVICPQCLSGMTIALVHCKENMDILTLKVLNFSKFT